MTAAQTIARVDATLLAVPLDPMLRAYGSDQVSVVLVTVADADGRVGTGFTYTLGLGASVVRSMVTDVLAPLVTATSVAAWADTAAGAARRTRRLGRAVFAPALSALDIAVWDLRGIGAGLPLYRLLGREATAVAMYGSGRSGNGLTTAQLVDGSVAYVAEGYRGVKLRVGARTVAEDLARVSAVRAAIGDQVPLMVDCNEQLDRATAVPLAQGLARLGACWIEEPFPAEDVAAHADLAGRVDIPIATGEHLVGRHEFAGYLHARAAALLQPDAALTGGITETLHIAALAAEHRRPIAFHSLPELHVHLAMGDPNVSYVEHFPILDPLLAAPLAPVDGQVTAPDTPGHGIAWDPEALAAYAV